MKKLRITYVFLPFAALLVAVLAIGILLNNRSVNAAPPHTGPPPGTGLSKVQFIPIGNPIWRPADAHIFTAPVGTADSGYAEFLTTLLSILPPPNHVFHPHLGVGPGAPHEPPYDHEMGAAVAAAGYQEGRAFRASDFSDGAGIWLAFMAIPFPGTTGSSPDFASGPIIPNSIFPIHFVAYDYHNGHVFSTAADFDLPPLDATLNPPFNVDGHSHIPLFLADNADFGPPGANLSGEYLYHSTLTDATGNGWTVQARFTVTATH